MLRKRGNPPPRLPDGWTIHIGRPDHAGSSEPPDDQIVLDALGATFLLRYVDIEAVETRRRITLHHVYMMGSAYYLGAHCHERDAYWTFRADGSIELVHLKTGEVIENAESWCKRVLAGGGPHEIMRNARYDAAILVAFGRSDGWLDDDECAVIADHILDCANYPPGISARSIESLTADLYPDQRNFDRAADRMRFHPAEHRRRLIKAVRRVIDIDGELDPEETDLFLDLQTTLQSNNFRR